MAHIAILCHPARGRLYPMIAMGRALSNRGHQVTVVGHQATLDLIESSGLDVLQVDADTPDLHSRYPNPTGLVNRIGLHVVRRLPGPLSKRTGELKSYSRSFNSYYDHLLGLDLDRTLPMLEKLKPDFLLGSDTSFASSTIADLLKIPFMNCCTGIPLSVDPRQPPEFTLWTGARSRRARMQNRIGNRLRQVVERPVLARLNKFRRAHGLPRYRSLRDTISPEGCLCQFPVGFDLPLRPGRPPIHYTGPTLDQSSRESVDFPWDQLDGRPLVYASLGTVNDSEGYFSKIALACSELPVQLVITRGGGVHPLAGTLPGDPIVVDYAPQLDLVKRAQVVITHASANSIIESLSHGVPLICLPQVFDQYGTSVRALRTGSAVLIPPHQATAQRIREALSSILGDERFAKSAADYHMKMEQSDPIADSVRLIESALPRDKRPESVPGEPEGFTVTADDGVELRGLRWKGAPDAAVSGTVFCLHGLCSDCNGMELVARELSRHGLDVIAPDYRGHGLSGSTPGRKMTVRQLAQDVRSVCSELGVSRTWLFSQSFGGRIGVELLSQPEPDLEVQGLFAFAPPWRLNKSPIKRLPKTVLSCLRHIRSMARNAGYHALRTPSRQPYTHMRDMPDFHRPVMIEEVKSVSLRRYARLLLGMKLADFRRSGGWSLQTDRPVHVYAGRNDRCISNANLEELAEHAGLELNWLDCHHVSLMTNAEHAEAIAQSTVDRISQPHSN